MRWKIFQGNYETYASCLVSGAIDVKKSNFQAIFGHFGISLCVNRRRASIQIFISRFLKVYCRYSAPNPMRRKVCSYTFSKYVSCLVRDTINSQKSTFWSFFLLNFSTSAGWVARYGSLLQYVYSRGIPASVHWFIVPGNVQWNENMNHGSLLGLKLYKNSIF